MGTSETHTRTERDRSESINTRDQHCERDSDREHHNSHLPVYKIKKIKEKQTANASVGSLRIACLARACAAAIAPSIAPCAGAGKAAAAGVLRWRPAAGGGVGPRRMTSLGAARVDAVKEVTGGEPPTRWVHLQHIQWVDERGRDRTWEAAVRANARPTGSGVADAVAVLARLRYGNSAGDDGSLGTVLVAQFRPPIGAITLELPAGLIDAGESPGQAAVRELKEETGFIGEVSRLSPVVYSSPGLTNESMQLVQIDVDMTTEDNRTPVPEQEDSECIENIMGTPSVQLAHRVHINFADSIILLLRLQGSPWLLAYVACSSRTQKMLTLVFFVPCISAAAANHLVPIVMAIHAVCTWGPTASAVLAASAGRTAGKTEPPAGN